MGENPEMVLHQELRFNIDLNHTLICTVNSNNEHFDPWLDLEIHGETRADLGGKQVDSWSCFGFLTCCISVVTTLQLGWFARMTSVLFFQIETSDFCPYDFVFEKLSGVKPSKCLKYTNSYRVFKKFGSHVTRLYYSSEAIQRYSPPCLKMSPRVFLLPTTKEMVEPLPIHIAVKCLGDSNKFTRWFQRNHWRNRRFVRGRTWKRGNKPILVGCGLYWGTWRKRIA